MPQGWDYYAAYSLWFGLFWGFGFAVPVAFLCACFAHRRHSSPIEALLAMSVAVMFSLASSCAGASAAPITLELLTLSRF